MCTVLKYPTELCVFSIVMHFVERGGELQNQTIKLELV